MFIFEKIKFITNLRKENRDLKEKVEALEKKVQRLERAVTWQRISPGGLGCYRR